MAICLYPADCTDFSTNGLGALTPLECVVSEEARGMFELELRQPIDDTLRWAQLATGCIVKAPVPARESPLYEEADGGGGTVTRAVWEVAGTTVGAYMRSGPGTNHRKYGCLKNGARLTEIGRETVGSRLWVHGIVQEGGRECWMSAKWLKQVGSVTETIRDGAVIGARSVRCVQSREQLFRVYSVERDAQKRIVTAKAAHIFYDLRANLVGTDCEAERKAVGEALRDIFENLAAPADFRLHVAASLAGEVSGDYGWKNPVECLLDPDEGILSQTGALLVRDNWDVYVLPDTVRDSGVTIRRGKNLKGVTAAEDASGIVTRVIPCGKDRDGGDLFLADPNYVESPNAGLYPFPHVRKIDCDVKVVDKDPDGVTTFSSASAARAKLRELAEREFSEKGIDLPSYGLEVDFVLLQGAEGCADYAGLQAVFLNDTVTVIDNLIGLTAKVRVTGYRWNALTLQYESVTLGEYAKIAVATIEQLTADSVAAVTARIQEIVSQQITTDRLYAALAELNQAVIEHADIHWADVESLTAAVAALAQASIGTADIGWAQIKDLITGAAIITEGEAGRLMISRLAVTEANMVSLTTGELVVKGEDGRFYSVTVDAQGNVQTRLKQVTNGDVTDLSIDAGEKLIEGSVTAACLNATDIFADNAIIRQMIAQHLDVNELFAREAFLQLLRTSKIVGERTLEIVAQDASEAMDAASGASERVNELGGALDDCVTRREQAVYLRQVAGEGVYVGFEDKPAQAFINATGSFEVLVGGESVTSMGNRVQKLGKLTIYQTSDDGCAFISGGE